MVEEPTFRYSAFISYSNADSRFAKRLHQTLERYRVPRSVGRFSVTRDGKPNSLYPVFRDREELPIGVLDERIKSALTDAATLVVVCSPEGARSAWVNKEIEHFRAHRGKQHICCVIPPTVRPDQKIADIVPDALRDATDQIEMLFADARPDGDGFNKAVLKTVAAIVAQPPGILVRRDQQRSRIGRMVQIATGLGVAALLVWTYVNRDAISYISFAAQNYRPFVVRDETLVSARDGTRFKDCRTDQQCPEMVILPPGASGERLAIATHEVTMINWEWCVRAGECPSYTVVWAGADRPAINVSYLDAERYADWLSRVTGARYRLPTSADWELAMDEAQRQSAMGSGCVSGPNRESSCHMGLTYPVKWFPPNQNGVFALDGNVAEWVHGRPPTIRGGSWQDTPELNRAVVSRQVRMYGDSTIGFRVVRDLSEGSPR